MQNTTTTPAGDLLRSQNSVNDPSKPNSSEIMKRDRWKDTGLYIVGNDERGYMATWGKYKVTGGGETYERVIEKLEKMDLNMIMAIMLSIAIATHEEAAQGWRTFNQLNEAPPEVEKLKGE